MRVGVRAVTEVARETESRQALDDFRRYLSDEIAPLMAADGVRTLMALPPQLAVKAIVDWLAWHMQKPDRRLGASAYLFHALTKVHLVSEFKLLEPVRVQRYLTELTRQVLPLVPEAEREAFKVKVSRLGEQETALMSAAEYLHRPREEAARDRAEIEAQRNEQAHEEARKTAESAPSRETMHFSRLVDRLGGGGQDAIRGDHDLVSHVMSAAALQAKDAAEFEQALARLRESGLNSEIDKVFSALSSGLPGWEIEPRHEADRDRMTSRVLEAMRRIIEISHGTGDSPKRFGEMIYAAVEQLNEGRLAQAASMIELGERLIAERKVDRTLIENVVGQAQASILATNLRRFAETPGRHGLLRRVLTFFPGYRVDALLTALADEPRRDRRKLLLALVEVHGSVGRELILEHLEAYVRGETPDPEGFQRRNLAFLLRRIPPEHSETLAREIAALSGLLEPGVPDTTVKEAIGALGQLQHPGAEAALAARLRSATEEAARLGRSLPDPAPVRELLDRLCAALGRTGTRSAARTVAHLAFSPPSNLGDLTFLLEHLGQIDLAFDAEQVASLVRALDGRSPGRVLGMLGRKSDPAALFLVRALSRTTAPGVREALAGAAERFAGSEVAEAAQAAIARIESARRSVAQAAHTMSGDLELFGLPSLLQTLAASDASGVLTLLDPRGAMIGALDLSSGRIAGCSVGRLMGEEAVYSLFERPVATSFTFRGHGTASAAPAEGAIDLEVLEAALEGARRHDEYGQARALAPDGSGWSPGFTKPKPLAAEPDLELTRKIWEQAAAGRPPDACEADQPAAPFRVRRLYAWWIEQGSLRPAKPVRA